MRSFALLVLMGCASGDPDEAGGRGDVVGPRGGSQEPLEDDARRDDPAADTGQAWDTADIECGLHASPFGGLCYCDEGYEPCPSAVVRAEGHCCSQASRYLVYLNAAVVRPYKDVNEETPWDWNGTVPQWLRRLVRAVAPIVDAWATQYTAGSVNVGAAANDLLNLVNRHAPDLLEGTVPPDPYWVVREPMAPLIFESAVQRDTIDPVWSFAQFEVEMQRRDRVIVLELWDADFSGFDEDWIGTRALDRESLGLLAELGAITLALDDDISLLEIEVYPLP